MPRTVAGREPGPLLTSLIALLVAAGTLVGGLAGAGFVNAGFARAGFTGAGFTVTPGSGGGAGSADAAGQARAGHEPQRTTRSNGPRWTPGRDAPDDLGRRGGLDGPAAVGPPLSALVIAASLLVLLAPGPARLTTLRPSPSRGRGPPAGRVTFST